jgi:hypothetical protein
VANASNDTITSLPFTDLLDYGFLGLSVIMAVLGFLLFRYLINQEKPNPTKVKAAKFYAVCVVAVMIIAGVLELSEGVLESRNSPGDAELLIKVIPWTEEHPAKYGEIRIIQRTEAASMLDDTGVLLKVDDDPEIQIQIQNLIDLIEDKKTEIQTMQRRLESTQAQVADTIAKRSLEDAIAEPARVKAR